MQAIALPIAAILIPAFIIHRNRGAANISDSLNYKLRYETISFLYFGSAFAVSIGLGSSESDGSVFMDLMIPAFWFATHLMLWYAYEHQGLELIKPDPTAVMAEPSESQIDRIPDGMARITLHEIAFEYEIRDGYEPMHRDAPRR
jgi:hypothetical protein